MTFWPLTNSDLPTNQTFHQFHDLYTELDLHRIMSGFHGAFATGVASQQGTLTLPDTWFRPQFWDLLMLQLLRPNSSNLPCLYSTFHLEYPLVLSRFYFFDMPDRQRVKARRKLGFSFGMVTSDLDAPPSKVDSAVKTIISQMWQVKNFFDQAT